MKFCTFCETTYADQHTTCGNERCEGRGSKLVPSRQLEPGTVIRDKYRIVRFIGKGGMGTVYLADHIHLREQHALKFISDHLIDDPKVLRRFQLEAQAVRRLTDPNIVEVYDLDQANDGAFYIAMEFVRGPSLDKVIVNDPLSVERAIAIARSVAKGLAAAHAKNIIHRDIKPDNILLDHSVLQSTGIEIPKLLDFGIAAVKETSTAVSHTHSVMLTAQYAAPEQWDLLPAAQIDGRTDLYALGGVLHEMLTGRTCFHSTTFEGWGDEHRHADRIPPSQKRPELANWEGLDDLVLSLLAKERNDRPATAAAVIAQLEAIKKRRPTVIERQRKTEIAQAGRTDTVLIERPVPPKPQPSKTWRWLASVVVVLAIGVAVRLATGKKAPPPPPPQIPGRLIVTSMNTDHSVIVGTSLTLRTESVPEGRTYPCTTSASGSCSLDELPPGIYRLQANHAGFQPYLQEGIRITSNEETALPITLQAQSGPPPPPPGRLTVTSKNPSGDVITGTSLGLENVGIPHGRTYACTTSADGSCTISDLIPGTYRLKADHADYRPYLRAGIRITSDADINLPITMDAADKPPPPSTDCTQKADAQLQDGDAAAAVATCQKVLDSEPNNRSAQQKIKDIKDFCNGQCPGVPKPN